MRETQAIAYSSLTYPLWFATVWFQLQTKCHILNRVWSGWNALLWNAALMHVRFCRIPAVTLFKITFSRDVGSKPGWLDTSVQVTYACGWNEKWPFSPKRLQSQALLQYEVKLCHTHSGSVSIGGGPSLGGIAPGGTNILRVGLSLGEDFKWCTKMATYTALFG